MRIAQADILRGDNTVFPMNYRVDRLFGFKNLERDSEFLRTGRDHARQAEGMPGWDGTVILGLSTIFPNIPSKFPVLDILRFLWYESSCPSITEVEQRLRFMAGRYPQIDCNGEDI